MTFPLILHFWHYSIGFHLVTDFLSTTVGVWLYWRSRTDDGVSDEKRDYILIGAALGALIGSRLIGALENPILFIHPPALLYYYASKTIIGGIAGGILGTELMKLIIKHKRSTGDRVTIPLIVAIIIGRIGCLFTGITDGTVGDICHLAWCFNQGDGVPRHPISLYEIIFLIIFLLLILYIKRKRWTEGVLFRVFVMSYFTLRFFIEYIKPTHIFALSFSITQIVCLLYVLWYTYDIYRIAHRYEFRRQ